MLRQAFMLMVVGTGTVFVFLVLMICVMLLVGRYYQAHADRFQDVDDSSKAGPPARQREQVVAAIAAALHLHRA